MSKNLNRYDILVVEDNPGDYLLVEDFLLETRVTKNIRLAKDFHSARDILKGEVSHIDLIFLDLSLPDLEGEELISRIKEYSKNVPIIILTGYTDVDFAIKTLSLGASDYLLKDVLNTTVLHKSILYNIERNKTMVNLKESEQRYSDLFHFSPLPMWVYDKKSLKFLDVNDAAIEHYGYSYEEFLAMDITDIRPPEEISALKDSMIKQRQPNKNIYHGEFTHLKKNGDRIRVEIRSNSFLFRGLQAQIILVNDVTERNLHIEAVEKQNEILKDIAWTQSHVVRAPLARLMGLVNAMKNERITDSDKEIFYNHILKSAEELDEIVKSVVSKSQEINVNSQNE
ncbi:response regulator [uncultured Marivirga sp.]|mgnify:CR=1 FL=1|uniref:response regulator n=1 Tax=uncultured Marivirga sp. TaxID=1123707 RepID=UPI0030EF5EFA|tara:strand:+ start:220998 stop:222020 length:1023 start_codon:yes stop_codon:yes gene_type:complete